MSKPKKVKIPPFLRDAEEHKTLSDEEVRKILQNWLTLNDFFKTRSFKVNSDNLKYLLYVELHNGPRVQILEKLMGRLMTVRRREENEQLRRAGYKVPEVNRRGRAVKEIQVP